jgi:hypothetical protein
MVNKATKGVPVPLDLNTPAGEVVSSKIEYKSAVSLSPSERIHMRRFNRLSERFA